jgi:hypothetical protein
LQARSVEKVVQKAEKEKKYRQMMVAIRCNSRSLDADGGIIRSERKDE